MRIERNTHKTVKKKHSARLQNTGSLKNARSNQTIFVRLLAGLRSSIMRYPAVKDSASIAVKMARDLRRPIVVSISR